MGVGTAAILSLTVAAQAAEGWIVDFEKAKAQAAKEGKSILMEFTGSDWCPPCKALHKNVLVKDVFKTEMPKSFVLLKLDSPRDKSKQTPEEIEQYKTLSAKYGIKGVPTIFLADAKGRPYYETVGYSGDTAEKYVANLKDQLGTLAKRDAAFANAEKASGAEKAKLLAEGLSLVNDEMALKTYGDVVSQIIELDADNEAGLKAKFAGLKNSVGFKAELEATMRDSRGEPEDTLAAIDTLRARGPGTAVVTSTPGDEDGASITLEPGGQFELSGAPLESIRAKCWIATTAIPHSPPSATSM